MGGEKTRECKEQRHIGKTLRKNSGIVRDQSVGEHGHRHGQRRSFLLRPRGQR
jgi:hypothetical protein